MASKNNPGAFDCYADAHPDEPMFVLLGRDPDGPALVEAWATVRERNGEDPAKVAEARACATAMRAWLTRVGKQERGTAQATSDETTCQRCGGRKQSWQVYCGAACSQLSEMSPGTVHVGGFTEALAKNVARSTPLRAEPPTPAAAVTCGTCGGAGEMLTCAMDLVHPRPCPTCSGTGRREAAALKEAGHADR